eukprot:UN03529
MATSSDGAAKLARSKCKRFFIRFSTDYKNKEKAGKVWAWDSNEVPGKLWDHSKWEKELDVTSGKINMNPFGVGELTNGYHGEGKEHYFLP